ncbi:type III PLP-dependent enzyme [Nocardia sp. NBC_01730]|uniref:type III PLP-dependent enzyme n=1 Tax=Nocardia sp. NBC_01730 TaxID=2975998 RepID=UPI002E109719|nr:type III PLP-dependent enzyme [Nocardia sp. NBC_01730]
MIPLSDAVRTKIDTLASAELPAYIYDLAGLRDHAAFIRSVLPERVTLYYAAKANPESKILAALSTIVDGFEVSSGGELSHVAEVVPGLPLAFGGPGKTRAELRAALDLGVHRIHVESVGELRMLAQLAADRPGLLVSVLLRVNVPVGSKALSGSALSMGGRPSQFGLDPSQAEIAAAALAGNKFPSLRWEGVHAHLASGLEATDLVEVAESVVRWSTDIAQRHGVQLTEVNVGGGMNVDYRMPGDCFDWTTYGSGLAAIADAWPGLQLSIEPGRAMTAYCGWYVTDVLDVKPSHGAGFAVVRGGTHHLRTPAAKGHDQPCAVVAVDGWDNPWPRPTAAGRMVTICGQLCTPKDTLARNVPAVGLRVGDRVAFGLAGAYAWNISHHNFLMHPPPSVHIVDDALHAEVE